MKLEGADLEWLEAEVERRKRGDDLSECYGAVRWVSASRSGVIRALVKAARLASQGRAP